MNDIKQCKNCKNLFKENELEMRNNKLVCDDCNNEMELNMSIDNSDAEWYNENKEKEI